MILLDMMMPGIDGLAVCRAVRERVDCPIVFLTARVEESDRVIGFAAGSDDYITKPFSIKELDARIGAHLRRERRRRAERTRVSFGRITIDYSARTLFHDSVPVPLARREFDIVELLSLHPGQVFSKEHIYECIWGYDAEGDDTTVYEHIKRVRRRLEVHGAGDYIQTVWGVGYRWSRE